MHKIVTYIFITIVFVMVATHASGFATAVTAVGGQATNETSLLTGAASATKST